MSGRTTYTTRLSPYVQVFILKWQSSWLTTARQVKRLTFGYIICWFYIRPVTTHQNQRWVLPSADAENAHLLLSVIESGVMFQPATTSILQETKAFST